MTDSGADEVKKGLLYASGWSHKKEIRVYDVNDGMRFVKEITVTGTEDIHRIQGGEFYNGAVSGQLTPAKSSLISRLINLSTSSALPIPLCA